MNSVESRLARIETGVEYIKESIHPLVIKTQKHEVLFARMHQDSKWKSVIFFSISGAIATVSTLIIEWFRHS